MSRTVNITMNPEVLENLRLELRRGCLIVAVLAELRSEQYGYTLRKSLAENGLVIDEGTLYPLLRRLETQGLLASEWREQDKRNKRFYRLSPQGELILTQLLADWEMMYSSLEAILKRSDTPIPEPYEPAPTSGEAPESAEENS
jgi:PadR family transcriptional regulator PadR